jgi:ankyrin repeat protein
MLKTSCNGPVLTLALKAAVNCSSASRYSPLHAAVEADCCRSLQAVLELGGQLESKDRSGSTPLFLACEMGKLACACALMAAGAELQTRNSAGEAPLYIAALKGHERIVEELLKEFRERSLRWTDATYGDDWNPLMAAAVADRHAIAVRLLRSAGCAKRLVTATNRYGQTAAHIAARRGGNMLLLALCNAGGMDIAKIKDNSRKTPLDIARAHRHEAAVSILKYGTHTPQLPMRGHKL